MQKKQNNLLKHPSIPELIEEQIRVEGGLKSKPVKPLQSPVLALPHTPIYKMHRYWARRPHNVFAHIIQHYTNPGDLVLDPFCGGGVTVVESLKLRRRVVGIDINPLATWITQVEVEPVDIDELEQAFKEWFAWCEEKLTPLFKAECGKCGKEAQAEWYEWSNVVVCPGCDQRIVLSMAQKLSNATHRCPNKRCGATINVTQSQKGEDILVGAYVNCQSCGSRELRKPLESDHEAAMSAQNNLDKIVRREKLFIPPHLIPDMDRMRDDALALKNVSRFTDLFTPRHLIGIGRIRKFVEDSQFDLMTQNALLHVFSGMLRFCNKMVFRSDSWQGGNPIEWAGHAYWMPNVYNEINPLLALRKKYITLIEGKREIRQDIGGFFQPVSPKKPQRDIQAAKTCWIINQSSEKIRLEDESVDVVITDPPFGGNVQYLELSDFYLVWLDRLVSWGGITSKSSEAIVTRNQDFVGAKDMTHYENLLYRVFRECRRVLKTDGWMVMTFHNKDISVWMALHRAAQRAGFRMPTMKEARDRGMIYQPAVKHYTNTFNLRASGSLLGDFILTFKPVDTPDDLDAVRDELTLAEEKKLHMKAEEIIRYHGGVEDRDLWTGLMPYLSETGILARVAKFSIKSLLSTAHFTFDKKAKKWYMTDMLDNGSLSGTYVIPAEQLTQQLVYSYLREKKHATLDDLLKVIYTNLVNSQLPQMANIEKVLKRYCKTKRQKGAKRDVYVWSPSKLSPIEEERVRLLQTALIFEAPLAADHNGLIIMLARQAIAQGYDVHAGCTEQRRSPTLKDLSLQHPEFEVGLSPDTFDLIKEIDLLILKNKNIRAAVEIVITLSTLNKAINDRFRNLLHLAPNLNIPLVAVVKDDDYQAAIDELRTPVNRSEGLPEKVKVLRLSQLNATDSLKLFL
jgi:DNA modification methylase/DNA-directed RNA polymerase subunit RPC12/RpoP